MIKKSIINIVASIIIVIGLVFLYIGFDKKNNYYNSDISYSDSKNVYVGGDAYNYIINANYFTGYMVLSGSCFICGTILLGMSHLTTILVAPSKKLINNISAD